MRIITGKSKGTKLNTLEGQETRPTAERTKEAVFSTLQFDIEGREVLDLFAGSGQMGLEALSRGARSACFVDSSKRAVEIIKGNAQKTRLFDDCSIFCDDALSFLKKQRDKGFDIVFLDPPYASDLINKALLLLVENKLVKSTSYIVCESDSFDILSKENLEKYEIVRKMKHGVAHILILKCAEGVL